VDIHGSQVSFPVTNLENVQKIRQDMINLGREQVLQTKEEEFDPNAPSWAKKKIFEKNLKFN